MDINGFPRISAENRGFPWIIMALRLVSACFCEETCPTMLLTTKQQHELYGGHASAYAASKACFTTQLRLILTALLFSEPGKLRWRGSLDSVLQDKELQDKP